MARKVLLAALWIASLAAVGAVSARASQAPPASPIQFTAKRIATNNGFTLLQTSVNPYIVECFVILEGADGTAMAPARCP